MGRSQSVVLWFIIAIHRSGRDLAENIQMSRKASRPAHSLRAMRKINDNSVHSTQRVNYFIVLQHCTSFGYKLWHTCQY